MHNLTNRPYDGTLEQAAQEYYGRHRYTDAISGIGYVVEHAGTQRVLSVQYDAIGPSFAPRPGDRVTLGGGVIPWTVVRRVDVGGNTPQTPAIRYTERT